MNGILNEVKFDDRGLIPVVAQDSRTDEVLMVAYMNKEALEKSVETGKVHYWSRSRNRLWLKGETSGHFQLIKSISLDCDSDTLLIKVVQKGAACHTGHHSCFYRKLDIEGLKTADASSGKNGDEGGICSDGGEKKPDGLSNVLQEVYDVIMDRKSNPKEGSYTNYLFEKGVDKILKKIGEEAAEVIVASKNGSKDEIKGEIADLFYHIMVLMAEKGLKPDDIWRELAERR